jgi:hypothetical protein
MLAYPGALCPVAAVAGAGPTATDALAGPEPETPADQQRARDRERIERAFPEIDC